jgi:hypothetical protein
MVQRIINTGIQGNDGTGDSIRDSFRKVNENFTEIYAVFGLGGRLTLSSLDDGTTYLANQIIAASQDGTKLSARTLTSSDNTILISNLTDSIDITTTAAKLISDGSPTLRASINAQNSYTIGNLPNPSQSLVDSFNLIYSSNPTTLNQLPVTVNYGINNYVAGLASNITDNAAGTYTVSAALKTREQPLSPQTSDTDYDPTLNGNYLSTEVMQRKDVVYRGGDTMSGTLTLSDHPGELSGLGTPNGADDLQAATKLYVDNNSYYSNVNLYVSASKGDDTQLQTPAGREGRSWAYSYKTIGAAALQAENLINLAQLEAGPYRQTISYTQAAQQVNSVISGISLTSGNSGIQAYQDAASLLESNKSFIQTETIAYINKKYVNDFIDTGFYDIIKGIVDGVRWDLILGTNFNSITQITSLFNPSTTNQNIIVNQLAQVTDAINYIKSEISTFSYDSTLLEDYIGQVIDAVCYDLVFGSNYQSIQAGLNFNHYGTNLSSEEINYALEQLKTRMLALTDVASSATAIASINSNIALIETIIISGKVPTLVLPTTGTTTTEQTSARDLLLNNVAFIQAEIISYLSDNYPDLIYSQSTCKRDVKYIVWSLVYDLMYGGNSQSIYAGMQYWGYPYRNTFEIANSEKSATINAVHYINTLVQAIITNTPLGTNDTLLYQETVKQYTNATLSGVVAGDTLSLSIAANVAEIQSIVSSVTEPSYPTPTLPDTTSSSLALRNARSAILAQKSSLESDADNDISSHFDTINDTNVTTYINGLFGTMDQLLTYGIANTTYPRPVPTFPALPSGSITGYPNAASGIIANLDFIAEDAYLYAVNNHSGFVPAAGITQFKRSIKWLAEAVAYDLTFTSSDSATNTASSYAANQILFNFASGSGEQAITASVISTRVAQTINLVSSNSVVTPQAGHTINQTFNSSFVAGSAATSSISNLFTFTVNKIVGAISVPLVVYPSLSTYIATEYYPAQQILANNDVAITNNVLTYITNKYQGGFAYNQSTCYRDIGYIIDAMVIDLLTGGTYQSINAGKSYFKNTSALTIAIGTQYNETFDGLQFAENIALQVLNQITALRYSTASQTVDLTKNATAAISTFQTNYTTMLGIIQTGFGSAPTPTFGSGLYSIQISNGGRGYVDQGTPGQVHILPGKILIGNTSGATGLIVSYTAGILSSNDTIVIRLLTPGFFAFGETLDYGETVKDLNITIQVESGIYYEDYPIRIPTNCTIKGDDFRRTIIRPLDRISQSPWRTVFFYRDAVIDGLQTGQINFPSLNRNGVDFATNVSLTLSAATGNITATLGSGTAPTSWIGLILMDATSETGSAGKAVVTTVSGNVLYCKVIYPFNSSNVTPNIISGGSWHLYGSLPYGRHYLTDPFNIYSTPLNNKNIDVFLCNDATRIKLISGQGHGGFMMVLDPEGQIKTKSPYGQECGSFSGSINKQRFAGGQFIDGYTGRTFGNVTAISAYNSVNGTSLTITGTANSGLDARAPQVPTSFYVEGVRYQINDVINYSQTITQTTANYVSGGASGSNTITVDSTTGIVVGQLVIGNGIPAYAYVDPLWDGSTTIKLSTSLTAQASGSYTFALPQVVVTLDSSTPFYPLGAFNNSYTNLQTTLSNILDAISYDMVFGTNYQSVKAGLTYLQPQNAISGLEKALVIQGLKYANTLIQNLTSPNVDTTGLTAISNNINTISSILANGLASVPTINWVSPTGVTSTRVNAKNILQANKAFIQQEITSWIASNYDTSSNPDYNALKSQRDIGYIIDAITYDILYANASNNSNSQTYDIAQSFYSTSGSLLGASQAICLASFVRLNTILDQILVNTSITPTPGNNLTQNTSYTAASSAEQDRVASLVSLVIDYVGEGTFNDSFQATLTSGSNILTNVSWNPYLINGVTLSGTGIPPGATVTSVSSYVNDIGGSITISASATATSPTTNNNNIDGTTVTIVGGASITRNSPTISAQSTNLVTDFSIINSAKTSIIGSTGSGIVGYIDQGGNLTINFETAGNRSMLANDYTQVNDLGYGILATNNGLTEQVSTFTYYCHTAYWALNGGQIRSVSGSNSNGDYGLRASGYDTTEIPNAVTLVSDMVQTARIYKRATTAQAMTPTSSIPALSVWIIGYKYIPFNNSELEIDHTQAGGNISRYLVSSVQHAGIQIDGQDVLQLNFSTSGTGGTSVSGLAYALYDGQLVTIRVLQNAKFTNIATIHPTRPSTSLQYTNNLSSIYRIISYTLTESTGESLVATSFGATATLVSGSTSSSVITVSVSAGTIQPNQLVTGSGFNGTFTVYNVSFISGSNYVVTLSSPPSLVPSGTITFSNQNLSTAIVETDSSFVYYLFSSDPNNVGNADPTAYSSGYAKGTVVSGSTGSTTLTVNGVTGTIVTGMTVGGLGFSGQTVQTVTGPVGGVYTITLSSHPTITPVNGVWFSTYTQGSRISDNKIAVTAVGQASTISQINTGTYITTWNGRVHRITSYVAPVLPASGTYSSGGVINVNMSVTGVAGTINIGDIVQNAAFTQGQTVSNVSGPVGSVYTVTLSAVADNGTPSGSITFGTAANAYLTIDPNPIYNLAANGLAPAALSFAGAQTSVNGTTIEYVTYNIPNTQTYTNSQPQLPPVDSWLTISGQSTSAYNGTYQVVASVAQTTLTVSSTSGLSVGMTISSTTPYSIVPSNCIVQSVSSDGQSFVVSPACWLPSGASISASFPTTVASIIVTGAGSGEYTTAPQITVSGGGAVIQATAVAIVDGGYISGATLTLVNGGFGYTSVPTVTASYGTATFQAVLTTSTPFTQTITSQTITSQATLAYPTTVGNISGTATSVYNSGNYVTLSSVSGLTVGNQITFTTPTNGTALGNLVSGTPYWILSINSMTSQITISTSQGGSVFTPIGSGSASGTMNFNATSFTFGSSITPVSIASPSGSGTSTYTVTYTIPSTAIVNGAYYRVSGNSNPLHNGVWPCASATGTATSITLTYPSNPGTAGAAAGTSITKEVTTSSSSTLGIGEPFSTTISQSLRVGYAGQSAGQIITNISTCRATGHDFLQIGTGGYNTSNYPNSIFGPPAISPSESNQVFEENVGRVFYVTTDENGIFRVGRFFTVDQGTGTVTFSASIALSNLSGLGFKAGVVVTEFSVDGTMQADSTSIVPVQSAIRTFVDSRLGLTYSGAAVPTSELIGPGFMPLNGVLAMSSNMNLGGYNINNLGLPVNATDAVNKSYVDQSSFISSQKDVLVSSPTAGNVLVYDTTNGNVVSTLASTNLINLSSVTNLTIGDVITFNGAGFGGIATATSTASTISGPAITVTSFVSKTGSGPYTVTFNIATQTISPSLTTNYVVSGNSNSAYNGTFTCTTSTLTTITLTYPSNPGTFGTGTTVITGVVGNVLTIGGTTTGAFAPGMLITGTGITYGTYISAAGPVIGTWYVTNSQSVASESINGSTIYYITSVNSLTNNITISTSISGTNSVLTTVSPAPNSLTFTSNRWRNVGIPQGTGTLATSGASAAGGTATLTFTTQSSIPYNVGETIVVTGVSPVGYNGIYTVTGATTGSVSYTCAATGSQTTAGSIIGNIINFTYNSASDTLTTAINSQSIVDSMINNTADIQQSKLLLSIAGTASSAPSGTARNIQSLNGVASFNNNTFTVTNGWVELQTSSSTSTGVTLNKIQYSNAGTLLGNWSGTGSSFPSTQGNAAAKAPEAIPFNTVVKYGNAVTNDWFTSTGILTVKTVASALFNGVSTTGLGNTYGITSISTSAGTSTVPLSDSVTGAIDVTQLNIAGSKAINTSGGTSINFFTPGGLEFITSTGSSGSPSTGVTTFTGIVDFTPGTIYTNKIAAGNTNNISSTATFQGQWSLVSGSTLIATYSADLAEYYEGDAAYEVGTVVVFGGDKEITVTDQMNDTRLAGVVGSQEKAAYIMYSDCPGLKNLVALAGRVPCKVVGRVKKGDMLTTSATPGYAVRATTPTLGAIIGKSLEDKDYGEAGVIEVAVGRN